MKAELILCCLLATTYSQLIPKIKPGPNTKGKPKGKGKNGNGNGNGNNDDNNVQLCNADTLGSPCGDGYWEYGSVFSGNGIRVFFLPRNCSELVLS